MSKKSKALGIFTAILRILLGVDFVMFGSNAFFHFLPEPDPTTLNEDTQRFMTALFESGYMIELIGVTQIFVGVLLLANRFVGLALVVLAPFMVNSVAFHIFLEPSGLIIALVFTAMMLYLAWAYRPAYRSLLKAKIECVDVSKV